MDDNSTLNATFAEVLSAVDERAEASARPDYALQAMLSANLFCASGATAGETFMRPKKATKLAADEYSASRVHPAKARKAETSALANALKTDARFGPPLALEYNSPSAEFEARVAGILAEPDSEFAKQFPESANWRLRAFEKIDFPRIAELVTKVRRQRSKSKWSEANPDYQREWRRSNPDYQSDWRSANPEKVAESLHKWRGENREKVALYRRDWKAANPEKLAAQKERAATRHYHRPFVSIDFEGQDYPGDDIKYRETIWPKHRIFLGGAGGWRRTHDAIALREMKDDAARAEAMREGESLAFEWLGDESKRPLTTREAFDWLLSLPEKFGEPIFVMFSFNYDVTQILADLSRPVAWEIAKRETFPDRAKGERKGRRIGEAPTFWREYAIKYIKSKTFELWRLRDPDKPWKPVIGKDGLPVVDRDTGRDKMELDASEHIAIYDAFGFYQEAFVKVTASLCENGYLSKEDHETIVAQKANRSEFDKTDFAAIKHYCGLELVALSKALTILRDGTDQMGLSLNKWSGAGSAASAYFRKEGIHKDHFPDDISTGNIPPWQDAAHHAYFGGRIELPKQGYEPSSGGKVKLFGYDIASAYPAACVELPSMRGGVWTHVEKLTPLRDLQSIAAEANVLSMFLVQWGFPTETKAPSDRFSRPVPFFPLPYRSRNGAILFPSEGKAWIMRDELFGALQWVETFFPDAKSRDRIYFAVREQWLFHPANDKKPFARVRDLYDLRRKTDKRDTLNKVIKLVINSIYGKMAQAVGGSNGKPPATACPYYAAAITANCRMRLMLAALHAPHDIVMFSTDGIISKAPLEGLPRVRDNDAGEKPDLGDWEMVRLLGGFYLQSGLYLTFTPEGRIKSKTRGVSVREMLMTMTMEEFLIDGVLEQWRKPYVAEDIATHPRLEIRRREYVTIGSAVSSVQRFRELGRWGVTKRFIDVHNLGVKRELMDCAPFYFSIGTAHEYSEKVVAECAALTGYDEKVIREAFASGEAFRCRMLVPSVPARNPTPDVLSGPRRPEWMDDEAELYENDYEKELVEIMKAESI